MKNSKFYGISLREIFTMFFLVFFVFLFNLVIRQERSDSLLSKLKNPFSLPSASADATGGVESGSSCTESGGGGESAESGCAVTSEIS